MNRDQNSYLIVIGVHSIMHLMHPNYCQITSINTVGLGVSTLYNNYIGVHNNYADPSILTILLYYNH